MNRLVADCVISSLECSLPMASISADEFLDQEELAESKHMYYAGVVTAMAGGSYEHGVLAMTLAAALHANLRGRGCRVVGSDVMLKSSGYPA